jgi:hypothetical protein
MTPDEKAIIALTDAIKTADPHIEALHSRIIEHGDRDAHTQLIALLSAAHEMIDTITQQDFLNVDLYAAMAKYFAEQGRTFD